MHTLAEQLNKDLVGTVAGDLLSSTGKNLYFPKGIVVQAQEAAAKATRYNATAGIAQSGYQPMILESVKSSLSGLTNREAVNYAPTGGIPGLRSHWQEELMVKNPGLKNKRFSLPLVTGGITHGIAVSADLFADKHTTVILPDLSWENYSLIFQAKHELLLVSFPFFDHNNQFHCNGLKQAISRAETEKLIIILNFPHNPTGYTPLKQEADLIVSIITEAAEAGKTIAVICDDAYFGLFWDPGAFNESLFCRFADSHEHVLAVKLDGATKEDFAWGLRTGFITFAGKSLSTDIQSAALEQKTLGAIRSSISSASMASQSLLYKAYTSPGYHAEKAAAMESLQKRFEAVKKFTELHPHRNLAALPFNSGYFLCLKTTGIDAEKLRQKLLEEKQIGTVSIGPDYLRVAYSCVDEPDIDELLTEIWNSAEEL
ncbi:MAG: aminotransferase class I/II-fold pyridoxal phosphate-dependent enzyme [Spirochaetales bacterium]|nr:aminotransferase class I/II-fold pyridoxal phosphate-dependent enzyme [Spirochaetales bacterium]